MPLALGPDQDLYPKDQGHMPTGIDEAFGSLISTAVLLTVSM